jgi:superfamily II RNA helicase
MATSSTASACEIEAGMFTFELSDWQKQALQSLRDGNHCLVTAPTGSGKTLPAEYAINYFHRKGKKVIYTAPIKALSNQKYHEFSQKFPHISFGILTGDIKENEEADVLIMTTEILCNYLHHYKAPTTPLDFNIDVHTELGCVVFDEVHYINDPERGTVWEECFMLMPPCVQLVMLSATINKPEKFAGWIEGLNPTKKAVLCQTGNRAVPLKHYLWFNTSPQMIEKKVAPKDKAMFALIEENTNKLLTLADEKNVFNDSTYHVVNKIKDHLHYEKIFLRRQHVFNNLVRQLNADDMLPAICFVYSRRNVERFAGEINLRLLEAQMMNRVAQECRHILSKFSNAAEYMALPEYSMLVGLLERGVGIHHSGMLPVFREMVELMFSKGYIKLLFSTETFAVGLNMPTKTVLFTNMSKFDGTGMRHLYSHEYTQQAGRAGRRGFDTVGHVIHMANMFELPDIADYKTIMSNTPQTIESKFMISFSLVLNMMAKQEGNTSDSKIVDFIQSSIIQNNIGAEMAYLRNKLLDCGRELHHQYSYMNATCVIPRSELEAMDKIRTDMPLYKNKMRKNKQRELDTMMSRYKNSEKELAMLTKMRDLEVLRDHLVKQLNDTEHYIENSVKSVQKMLHESGFLEQAEEEGDASPAYQLTEKGKSALSAKETHCLVMADLLEKSRCFADLEPRQIVGVLASFCALRLSEDMRVTSGEQASADYLVSQLLGFIDERRDFYYNQETKTNTYTGSDYELSFDMNDELTNWCDVTNEAECVAYMGRIQKEKGVFVGEFTKAIMKINSIRKELEKYTEASGQVAALAKLRQIGELTQKFVCASQSLYI